MKSADPKEVMQHLNRDPINSLAILELVPDTSKLIVSTILDAFINLDESFRDNKIVLEQTKKSLEDNQKFLTEYEQRLKLYDIQARHDRDRIHDLTKTVDNRVNQTTLAKFFLSHPDLVKGYTLGEENKIFYEDDPLSTESNQLLYLSLELEDYFGTRNIPLATLINGLKRYLVTIEKKNLDYQNILSDLAEEYLAGSKTRKRTRVPMSYLRTIVDIKPVEIRAVMTSAGYYVTTDKNNCIYFVRD